jgi:hypothetical protein
VRMKKGTRKRREYADRRRKTSTNEFDGCR